MGREHESELLRGALQRARQEESTQLVTLVGVPGIGKSRLVSELFAALDREPDDHVLAAGPVLCRTARV